jgi:fructosamine-3-kinase
MNTTISHPRADIYYWKCDRPAAFYGLHGRTAGTAPAEISALLTAALTQHFGEPVALAPGSGQGNHLTFTARIGNRDTFIRVEDGPDGDDYMAVEAHLLRAVAGLGVPAPAVLAVDATRRDVPFAWQVLKCIPFPDLNRHWKEGRLNLPCIAPEIGAHIARWQSLALGAGYGPFSTELVRSGGELRCYHASYADYFHTRLDRHLAFLVEKKFFTRAQAGDLQREIDTHAALLALPAACLVHKDLALWNILGTSDRIAAFIDFDDAIGGDPLDDISLLGCFHDGATIAGVLAGYATVRPLPADYRRRFWLHLLRNMIWKAVIRVGAGYFGRTSGFFLVGAGASGADLRAFTLLRIATALRGLRTDAAPSTLP